PKLKRWLAQDRIYALSYTTFIGSLLSQISIPHGSNRETSIEWRVVDILIEGLGNIRGEIALFESSAREEGWLEERRFVRGVGLRGSWEVAACWSSPQTRNYQDLFAGAILVGLTILWAPEECYLRAWRFALGKVKVGKEADVMQRVFIPNWSSREFETFVRKLGGLVNEMATKCGVEERGWVWKECEAAWRQVIWVEKEFWPDV
ncbi:uncharacterized protein MYCFIDRAFT_120763, partial [Pseudocercospora fijiensis CIRAD86]